ncbi:hypothetical protein Psta_4746 [Pirellula staleyi DSM 6068]|uniref:Restriction endonuclease type IV Mrr domain-containing protein n=1 Tax=Pirellula staleyi (strain ATCC 27377 / DSM 6068 / ICPB 4128) TaxID=530564 RepID=D2R856_PIRSD|nr:hypothetical protein [Pirellula staleyi]ADB19387.1 hypothetical protein Psta_4746 [Pirellula staleyi DSM 6068]
MSLPQFRNEDEFRKLWIAPFLSKMGFILPKNTHGPDEQGKDFIFADYDRFGHLRFLAAQVKLGDITTTRNAVEPLLSQIKRCLTVTIKYHKEAENKKVSAVYVMASGRITSNAREHIADALRQEQYGENVYFLDGDQLFRQDRYSTYNEDKAIRERILAFQLELEFNAKTILFSRKELSNGGVNLIPFQLTALSDVLASPITFSEISRLESNKLWYYYQELNRIFSTRDFSTPTIELVDDIAVYANYAEVTIELLLTQCSKMLTSIDAKYDLYIEH